MSFTAQVIYSTRSTGRVTTERERERETEAHPKFAVFGRAAGDAKESFLVHARPVEGADADLDGQGYGALRRHQVLVEIATEDGLLDVLAPLLLQHGDTLVEQFQRRSVVVSLAVGELQNQL